MSTQHGEHEATTDETVVVLGSLASDPLANAVDDAIVGDLFDDAPEAQPDRLIDASDFANLYIRHRFAMECHARRFLSEAHDVEDVIQETFLKLFLAISEIDTERQALAFERRVMTNLCIDRYRTAKRRPSVVTLDHGDFENTVAATERIDPVVQAEDAAVVREALALLSPLHRAALVKREIEEKPLPIIAAELGIPEESVKHLLYRARRALRRLLVGTSVEPGVELSTQEVAQLANRRLGRATLSAANALIVIVVAALTVVGAVRAGHPRLIEEPAGSSPLLQPAPLPSVGGAVQPGHTGGSPTGAGTGHGTSSGPRNHPVTPAPIASTPPSPQHPVATHLSTPPTTPPTKPTPPPTSTPPSTPPVDSAPSYRLDGSLAAIGLPQISNQVTQSSSQSSTALSRFAAPLAGGGSFVLDQTLLVSADEPPTLQLAAQVTNSAGDSVQSASSSTKPSVTPSQGNGQVAVAGQGVAPDGSSVNVLLVYNRALTRVLSETVSVAGLTDTSSSAAPSSTGASSATPTPTASGANVAKRSSAPQDDQNASGALENDDGAGSASLSGTPS